MEKLVAIITGGNRGIGFAITERLIDLGYFAYVIHEEPDKKIASGRLPEGSYKEDIVDVRNEKAIKRTIEDASKIGQIEVVVNNAGIASAKKFVDLTPKDFTDMFDVNVIGAFNVSKSSVPFLEQAVDGVIINISSVSGLTGFSTHAHYCASKAALVNMGRVMAKELALNSIRVNTVCPGPTEGTDMWNQLDKEYSGINDWPEDMKYEDKYFKKLLVKRMGQGKDVADAVEYLIKQSYTTGITLPVCGGNILQ